MALGYVKIDAETGFIKGIQFPQGPHPENGLNAAGTVRSLVLTEHNLPNEQCRDHSYFIENYVYNSDAGNFIYTGPRPNRHAVWDFENNEFTWDLEPVLEEIRQDRRNRLFLSDWGLAEDSPLTEEQKIELRAYRQALRDLPENVIGIPATVKDVNWPTVPSFL